MKFWHKVANRQTDKQRQLHTLLGGGNSYIRFAGRDTAVR